MEMISSMSSGISIFMMILLVIVALLYVLSIAFVIKDARARAANWPAWGIVSLIPFVGFLIYMLMRPELTAEDRDEQELDVALKRRQLMQYGECGHCGYPIESDFIMCPNCHSRLKNLCPACHHALNPEWSVCPYCTTVIHSGGAPAEGATEAPQRRNRTSAHTTGTHRRVK